ncbi:GGDEF domain-containing protein, partial [Pseudomonas stutzeri]
RLGGDEFAVLVTGPNAEGDARQVAERLLRELASPVPYRDMALTVTVSVGAAFYPRHARHFSGLYKAADEALYRAKHQGRANWVQQDAQWDAVDQPT